MVMKAKIKINKINEKNLTTCSKCGRMYYKLIKTCPYCIGVKSGVVRVHKS